MNFKKHTAELFIPDNVCIENAFERTTHMAISAHQDDIEIMAYHGISECFRNPSKWFFGVVLSDGAGSPRNSLYTNYSDDEMCKLRKHEQKKAAFIGEYSGVAMLDYMSSEIKSPNNKDIINELKELILTTRPRIVYTHNLLDRHDTHVAAALRTIRAFRELSPDYKPEKLYGCEVWRGLDWLNDEDKIVFDVSSHTNIATSLLGVFDSQINGGKRYDLATAGRRLANATYSKSHETDKSSLLAYAIDLTPLIWDIDIDISEYVQEYIRRFSQDTDNRLKKLL